MVAKYFILLSLVVAVAYGQTISEYRHPDEAARYLSNPHISKSISIPMLILDQLISCHIVYPNGASYEVFPKNNLPQSEFISSNSGGAFDACGVSFRNAPPGQSGTYELLGVVEHTWTAPRTRTLNMKKFHLEFYYSDSWQIPDEK